jgi:phage gp46-like protein
MPDLKLIADTVNDDYDLNIVTGDFETTDGFDSAIIMSLFCDGRADVSEKSRPELRRGFWGDETNDNPNIKMGSKLWLLSQARKTESTRNRAIDYVSQCLQWLVDEGYSRKIDVFASFNAQGLQIDIRIINAAGQTESKSFMLWQATGTLQ